jgi:2-hydroxychromene-2-carboxylate isomerase
MRDVLGAAGHDADAVLAKITTPEIKDALRTSTDEAVKRGVFGVPAMFVDGQMWWGQDRLDEVEHALRGEPFAPGWSLPRDTVVPKSGKSFDLYWDFSSPWAYLGTEQAAALAARTGAVLVWKPMLLGGLFKSIGQVDAPIMEMSDAKRRYLLQDLERTATKLGVPFRWPSRFPLRSVELLRIWLALPEPRRDAFRASVMRAVWGEDRDATDPAFIRGLIGDDADAIFAKTKSDEVKNALRANTEEAQRRGAFGAPTFVVGDELWWGQDRIPLVEDALRG